MIKVGLTTPGEAIFDLDFHAIMHWGTRSGKGPGRPTGQAGFTLEQVENPRHQLTHEPDACAGCGAGLVDAPVVGVERRQVFDLPV